jgi:2-polyprenyl-3-methyl-5-hydroxy-6-metoxy-1,4-benzoquinol methylase
MTDLFEEKAKDWDKRERIQKLSSAIGGCILQNVALNASMQVLDFGAGTGLIASQIAPRVAQITAVDISEAMLKKLQQKAELKDRVSTICQDITVTPLDAQFDLIVSAMAMHHVEDTTGMVTTFAQHLKPGGKIALADLDTEDGTFHAPGTEGIFHPGFDRTEFERLLNLKGFKNIQFFNAHTVVSETGSYPIFLVTASL